MILTGILAIQAGEHPRVIRMKLQTWLNPNERLKEDYSDKNDFAENETNPKTDEKTAA
jgi:flagellar motor component MotA